ncbi:MAG TPA: cytochrome c nitrite reductase small subunit [Fermentimonas caenicola]|jgi:cytochrome c nitrite reductase small subunit|uniref:Quinol oxidase n=1 Tax=Fermentimonas caenicola TaxID=1562970 RepID=A0A098C123_9BACT|nr:cytochrome c nitrite reductase small subunit [Lascolabacillus sp.]MBP6175809.1 cytochrome c nitrite reductase small subunit [Fermentimonas sp.]MDI9626601.1 cytochrome c nitrite reductase small subunit [Bacteroidota bacterium]TAH62123.1 MAG: cytochrome c nitrite reductase small subunit [Fermentimonas caenicola]MBP7104074.1 cytochrome c nitrite reductase small subunit [Fermentimonas sp.]MDD2607424.1 cytochrome c nitrite reductase small subunit [Lascolabacillus sp.]
MGKLRDFWDLIKPQGGWKFPAIIISGAFVGIFIYTFITSRAYTYLSDDPATCVNCHVMAPYYATWLHSSHGKDATCNDCHIPQDNYFNKYFVKGLNGYRHAAVFTKRTEEQAMTAIPMNSQALMNNCIRCHTQLNSEFVETGRHTWKEMQEIGGSVCWDCHRDVPHTRSRSLSSTPDARVPMPESNVPEWLHKITSGK